MEDIRREPWMIGSMGELLSLARSMEQEAIVGYMALAERMRDENRPDLERVFEALIEEERGHLGNVNKWLTEADAVSAPLSRPPDPLFDDEGTALVAPELLTSYRAFSMAVRNEERAFVFWSYVSAHAPSEEIRQAAERMAKDELEHVATLRRERRKAFHDLRRSGTSAARGDITQLELRLATHLVERAGRSKGNECDRLRSLAHSAEARSVAAKERPFGLLPMLVGIPEGTADSPLSLCEFLLDCYLDLGEREADEDTRLRAQTAAGDLIACLHALRA